MIEIIRKANDIKNNINSLENENKFTIKLIDYYFDGIESHEKSHKDSKIIIFLIFVMTIFFLLYSFIKIRPLFLGSIYDTLYLVPLVILFVLPVFYFGSFLTSKKALQYYVDIKGTLLEQNIEIENAKAFKDAHNNHISSLKKEVAELKNKMSFNNYSLVLQKQNDLNDQEFRLFEQWFKEFKLYKDTKENSREQRGKRIESEIINAVGQYDILENV